MSQVHQFVPNQLLNLLVTDGNYKRAFLLFKFLLLTDLSGNITQALVAQSFP